MTKSIPLVAIVGPTGIGKTSLALALAETFGGEIIGADSRQVYRYLDIGTAKPTPAERERAPHHLIDMVNPDEEYNVALFQQQADQSIRDVHHRGHVPLLVGGTGHYVWALLRGFRLPQVQPNLRLRHELQALAMNDGGEALIHQRLASIDPVAARRIDPRNVRRVIRAIEVTQAVGLPFSQAGTTVPPAYRTLMLGVTAPRPEVYRRINERVTRMIQAGWVTEVHGLLQRGYNPALPSLSGLGYRTIVAHIRGELSLGAAMTLVQRYTRILARRQYTWFKPANSEILWLDTTIPGFQDRARKAVAEFLR
ncbi:MAG: tRNA (adenosine(37)-N6)-dimethylallyltransferase MiaA [Chloroflexi bacterium]|nr:tRNA (adenosine(37)-N6)-dimethylallyltransferase MiaA [Chloroflexota bacterium]